MLAETVNKLRACVIVTLRSALLEAIDGRQRADLAAQLPVEAARVAGQESAPEGVAYAGRVHDLPLGDGGDVNGILTRIEVGAILAACDHQGVDMIQDLIQTPAC